MSDSLWPHGLGKNTGVGSLSLLRGIFPTQGLNPGLPHCRWILYHQSHKWSPNIKKPGTILKVLQGWISPGTTCELLSDPQKKTSPLPWGHTYCLPKHYIYQLDLLFPDSTSYSSLQKSNLLSKMGNFHPVDMHEFSVRKPSPAERANHSDHQVNSLSVRLVFLFNLLGAIIVHFVRIMCNFPCTMLSTVFNT